MRLCYLEGLMISGSCFNDNEDDGKQRTICWHTTYRYWKGDMCVVLTWKSNKEIIPAINVV